jgi:hypothetical protein
MDSMVYTHRPWRVAAIQWTGDNLDQVKEFLRGNVGAEDETGVRTDPEDTGRVLQFYGWGDDQEVDPGRWIVVHLGTVEPSGEVMYPDDFFGGYEREATDG